MLHFSHRIEQALHKNVTRGAVSGTERNSIVYQGLINAINIHRKAIEFVIIINLFEKISFALHGAISYQFY